MATSGQQSVTERRLRPIYGNYFNVNAIVHCLYYLVILIKAHLIHSCIFKIPVNLEAIDNMQYKKAVQLCDKVLKKQTDLQAGKALKALALSRQQRVEEATALINQLVLEKPVDEGTLQAMTMYFREAGQCELKSLCTILCNPRTIAVFE